MIRQNYRNRIYRHWTHRVIYACKVYAHSGDNNNNIYLYL